MHDDLGMGAESAKSCGLGKGNADKGESKA